MNFNILRDPLPTSQHTNWLGNVRKKYFSDNYNFLRDPANNTSVALKIIPKGYFLKFPTFYRTPPSHTQHSSPQQQTWGTEYFRNRFTNVACRILNGKCKQQFKTICKTWPLRKYSRDRYKFNDAGISINFKIIQKLMFLLKLGKERGKRRKRVS